MHADLVHCRREARRSSMPDYRTTCTYADTREGYQAGFGKLAHQECAALLPVVFVFVRHGYPIIAYARRTGGGSGVAAQIL